MRSGYSGEVAAFDDSNDEGAGVCAHCGEDVDPASELGCPACGEPLDDPARGICAFCGVATAERCAGCQALLCWECSDGARTGASAAFAGTPWCADCRPGAAV